MRDYEEAHSILQTGVQPDLVLIEPDKLNSGGHNGYRKLLLQTTKSSMCLIFGPGEQHMVSDARNLGVTRFFGSRPATS